MKKKELEIEEVKKKAKAEADRIAKEEADHIAREKELQRQREEAERSRQAALLLQKQEEERQRMKMLEEEAENSAKSEIENILNIILLTSSDEDDEEERMNGYEETPILVKKIKTEKVDDEMKSDKIVKPVNTAEESHLSTNLKEIGTLLVDKDVLFALRHLKEIGNVMQQKKDEDRNENKEHKAVRPPQRVMPGRSLFGSMSSMFGAKTYEVDPEDGDPVLQNIKKEKETMPFQSPPHTGRVFGSGWECLSSDAFTKVSSSKKSKATPGRGSAFSSPKPAVVDSELYESQADSKSKSAISAQTFITRKKMTNNNKMNIFEVIRKKGRDIIAFKDVTQTFYRIMTHYYSGLEMVPEDVRHKELQNRFCDFLMQNVAYTKVTHVIFLCFYLLSCFKIKLVHLCVRI